MTGLALKPWMAWNDRGALICYMCPVDKKTRLYGRYFLGIKWGKAARKKRANWLKTHKRCGFEVIQ